MTISGDGRRIACIRLFNITDVPSTDRERVAPWSIRVIDVQTGSGKEVWRSGNSWMDSFSRLPLGDRMEFDPEIAVRLVWAGLPVTNVPTHVRYFADGLSNFNLLGDNLRITWAHTRLVTGMLLRRVPLVRGRRAEDRS